MKRQDHFRGERHERRLVELGQLQTALLEQYKVVRGSITDVVHDRNTNNNMMLVIATAILGVQGFLLKPSFEQSVWPVPLATLFLVAVFGGVGVLLSRLWRQWSKSYDIGLKARYEMLREIEKHLPAQPFTLELEIRLALGYRSVTSIIESLATMFLGVFLISCVVSVALLACGLTLRCT